MAWSYDPTLAGDADRVRLLLGDTNSADPLLSDEEIAAMLTLEGSVQAATAHAADALALIFARKANSVTDDIGQRVSYGDRAGTFRQLAARMRATVQGASVSVNVSNQAVW